MNIHLLWPQHLWWWCTQTNSSSSMTPSVTSANHKRACTIQVSSTIVVTGVDMSLPTSGSMSGILIRALLCADNNGVPDLSSVLASTGTFAPPSSSYGWHGMATFNQSVTITPNDTVWLVYEDGGGTAPTGSNNWTFAQIAGNDGTFGTRQAYYDGSTWSTAANRRNPYVLQSDAGMFDGVPLHSNSVTFRGGYPSWAVYSNYRVGIEFSPPSLMWWVGAWIYYDASGSPPQRPQAMAFVDGAIVRQSLLLPTHSFYVLWEAPILIAPHSRCVLAMRQAQDAGNSSNVWRPYIVSHNATYRTAWMASNQCIGLFGTGNSPATWTRDSTAILMMAPLVMPYPLTMPPPRPRYRRG